MDSHGPVPRGNENLLAATLHADSAKALFRHSKFADDRLRDGEMSVPPSSYAADLVGLDELAQSVFEELVLVLCFQAKTARDLFRMK
jgi:hypothetical protein